MNAGHREGTIADGKADAFGGTGANVARSQNSGDGGFQRTWLTVLQRPVAGPQGVDTGQDISQIIADDRFRQPGASRLRANENENERKAEVFCPIAE